MSSRRTWLDQKIDVFLAEASKHGLSASRSAVSALIDNAVNQVALGMRVTPLTARRYLEDDNVRALVHSTAQSLAEEAPGAQLGELPPTHTVPVALVGRTCAGLAICTELAATAHAEANQDDLIRELSRTLSLIVEWGTALATTTTATDEVVAVPEAAIYRTVRELERGRRHLAAGIEPVDGGSPTALSQAFDGNITALQAEL